MPYIGSAVSKSTDIKRITFATTTTGSGPFALGWTPASENTLRVTVNGVVQQDSSMTLSGANLTLVGVTLVSGDELEVQGIVNVGAMDGIPMDGSVTEGKIGGNAVTAAKIASGAVGASAIASGAVGTSALAANSVTLTELEDGTQGDVLYYGASGAPTRLAKGTAGKVLKINAGATAPEWGDDAGGGMVLVDAQTLSADVTEWQCLNKMSSTYRNYLLLFNAIAPDSSSSSGNHIYIRFGDATISSDLNHKFAFRYINSNSDEAYGVSNGDTNGFRLGRHVQSEPNADSESSGISGAMWIYNPASASYNTSVNYLCTYWGLDEAHGNDRFVYLHGGGHLGNQSADLSFEFHSHTGGLEGTDITSYFRLYGLKDS